MDDSDRDGLFEINLLQPKVCIRPNVHSSLGVKCSVSHRAKHTLSLILCTTYGEVSPISVLGPCGNPVVEPNNASGNIFKARDFLIPGIHRSKAKTHRTRLTASSQQSSLLGAFLSLNYFVLTVSNHNLYKISHTQSCYCLVRWHQYFPASCGNTCADEISSVVTD